MTLDTLHFFLGIAAANKYFANHKNKDSPRLNDVLKGFFLDTTSGSSKL